MTMLTFKKHTDSCKPIIGNNNKGCHVRSASAPPSILCTSRRQIPSQVTRLTKHNRLMSVSIYPSIWNSYSIMKRQLKYANLESTQLKSVSAVIKTDIKLLLNNSLLQSLELMCKMKNESFMIGLLPGTMLLFRPVPVVHIWREIICWKHLIYPELNEMWYNYQRSMLLNICDMYPNKCKYAQIPGYHMLVGYTYKDLFDELQEFFGNEQGSNMRELAEHWFYCKLFRIVSSFEWRDYWNIIKNKSNYAFKLQSIIEHYDLSLPNCYTRVQYPSFVNPKNIYLNVCVEIDLWTFRTEFIYETWPINTQAREKGFDFHKKEPTVIRPCTKAEVRQYMAVNNSRICY